MPYREEFPESLEKQGKYDDLLKPMADELNVGWVVTFGTPEQVAAGERDYCVQADAMRSHIKDYAARRGLDVVIMVKHNQDASGKRIPLRQGREAGLHVRFQAAGTATKARKRQTRRRASGSEQHSPSPTGEPAAGGNGTAPEREPALA